jgi:hypothetical protein
MNLTVSSKRRQGGSAVIVVLALLAIILVFVGANLRSLSTLGRELKLIEQQQTRRLSKVSVAVPPAGSVIETNAPAIQNR